jgi:hypothetical protein
MGEGEGEGERERESLSHQWGRLWYPKYNKRKRARTMIKVDEIGQEYCLPCADTDEVEGVIVDRAGVCVACKNERGRE